MSVMTRNRTTYLMLFVLVPVAYSAGYAEATAANVKSATDQVSRENALAGDDADLEATGPAEDAIKELSVAPLDHIVYPDDRPEWLEQSLDFDKDSVRIVVVSGPCDSREESLDELKVMQRAAVSTYVSRLTESAGQFDFDPLSDEEIDHELVARRYSGEVTQGDATHYENAVELVFTDEKRQEIQAAWDSVAVRDRLGALGVIVAGGLGMLITSSAFIGLLSRRVDRRQRAQNA